MGDYPTAAALNRVPKPQTRAASMLEVAHGQASQLEEELRATLNRLEGSPPQDPVKFSGSATVTNLGPEPTMPSLERLNGRLDNLKDMVTQLSTLV